MFLKAYRLRTRSNVRKAAGTLEKKGIYKYIYHIMYNEIISICILTHVEGGPGRPTTFITQVFNQNICFLVYLYWSEKNAFDRFQMRNLFMLQMFYALKCFLWISC